MILISIGSTGELLDMSHVTFYDPRIFKRTRDNHSCNLMFYKTFFFVVQHVFDRVNTQRVHKITAKITNSNVKL